MQGLSFPIDTCHNHQPAPHTWGQDTTSPLLHIFWGKTVSGHHFQQTFHVPAAVLQTQGLAGVTEMLQPTSTLIIYIPAGVWKHLKITF